MGPAAPADDAKQTSGSAGRVVISVQVRDPWPGHFESESTCCQERLPGEERYKLIARRLGLNVVIFV